MDGSTHDHPDQITHDRARTAWLRLRRIRVYRVAARDVTENLEGVLVSIRQQLRG